MSENYSGHHKIYWPLQKVDDVFLNHKKIRNMRSNNGNLSPYNWSALEKALKCYNISFRKCSHTEHISMPIADGLFINIDWICN